jgi:hypothetical protein
VDQYDSCPWARTRLAPDTSRDPTVLPSRAGTMAPPSSTDKRIYFDFVYNLTEYLYYMWRDRYLFVWLFKFQSCVCLFIEPALVFCFPAELWLNLSDLSSHNCTHLFPSWHSRTVILHLSRIPVTYMITPFISHMLPLEIRRTTRPDSQS